MKTKTMARVQLQERYKKDSWIPLLVLQIFLITITILLGLLIYRNLTYSEPVRVFPTTQDGYLLPTIKLAEPMLNEAALNSWIVETFARGLSFNFTNLLATTRSVRDRFHKSAYESYLKIIQQDPQLVAFKSKKLIVEAIAEATPRITSKAIFKGVYTWKVEFSSILRISGAQVVSKSQKMSFVMLIQRVPFEQNPTGIQIMKLALQN